MADIFLSFFRISVSTGLIVAVLILLAPFLNKRYASKWKYWVWIFLALRLLIPFGGAGGKPAADLLFPAKAQSALRSETNGIGSSERAAAPGRIVIQIPAQMTAPISVQLSEGSVNITLLDIIALVWALGSLTFLSVHLISYFYFKSQMMKRGADLEDECILRQVSELKRELHIKSTIHAVKFPGVTSPMIIGFLKPVLILPDDQYASGDLYFILKHELVHWKRKDLYKKLLFVAANAVHWFNPFIWIMKKEAAVDMELSCDERVTQGADYTARKAYTETLLSTLQKKCVIKTDLSTQFYGGKDIMKKRFENILNKAGRKNGAVILVCAAVLSVSLGMLIGCCVTNVKAENAVLPNGSQTVMDIPQNGQLHGYISKFDNGSVTVDWQRWVTSEDEDWKPEYNEDAGFEVVDGEGKDIVYPLSRNCTYSVLENHYDPVVELDEKEFESYLSEMEFPVLWLIQLEDGQITDIREQYLP